MRKKVYISVLNQGAIRPELVSLLHNLTFQNKYELMISYPSEKPIANNRNTIVQSFLQRPEFDYLMMIDNDIVPPLDILNLVDYQKDIIAPVLFMYQQKAVIPLILERKPDGLYTTKPFRGHEGLTECDAVGTGCIVLSRKVLEAVRKPFMNEYDADGIKLYGLDIAFCRRAGDIGFKTYCHLDYVCSHHTELDLKNVYAALSDLTEHRDKLIERVKLCEDDKDNLHS